MLPTEWCFSHGIKQLNQSIKTINHRPQIVKRQSIQYKQDLSLFMQHNNRKHTATWLFQLTALHHDRLSESSLIDWWSCDFVCLPNFVESFTLPTNKKIQNSKNFWWHPWTHITFRLLDAHTVHQCHSFFEKEDQWRKSLWVLSMTSLINKVSQPSHSFCTLHFHSVNHWGDRHETTKWQH